MKKCLLLLLAGSILPITMAFGQPVGAPYAVSPPDGYVLVKNTNSLPKFDLDFHGGTPKDLVKAVEKVTGKPLNAVIANDCADLKIPAVSVKNVTTAELFAALKQVSKTARRYCVINTTSGLEEERMERVSTYGFQTEGVPNENSIWYFIKEGEDGGPYIITSPPVCRFYQLSPYLEAGYKVEDVTIHLRHYFSACVFSRMLTSISFVRCCDKTVSTPSEGDLFAIFANTCPIDVKTRNPSLHSIGGNSGRGSGGGGPTKAYFFPAKVNIKSVVFEASIFDYNFDILLPLQLDVAYPHRCSLKQFLFFKVRFSQDYRRFRFRMSLHNCS